VRASRCVFGLLLFAAGISACSRGNDSMPPGASTRTVTTIVAPTSSTGLGVRAARTVLQKTAAAVVTPIPCPTDYVCVNVVAEGPPATAPFTEVVPPTGFCRDIELPFPISTPAPNMVTAIPNPLQALVNGCVQTTISTVYTISFPYPPPVRTCPPGASFGFWGIGDPAHGVSGIIASLICPGQATPSPSPSPSPSATPKVTLTLDRATTTDAHSVTVDYKVSADGLQSARFVVYRGDATAVANPTAATKLGEQAVSSSAQDGSGNPALLKGKHTLTILPGVRLPPDTSKEFVVVVATYDGKTSQTYFRKWMLAALAHGFDREALLAGGPAGKYTLGLVGGYAIDPWESEMAASLKQNDRYDDVIPFDWMHTCAVYEHGLAQAAGVDLATLVRAWHRDHITHQGDVADLHFIGHSRGTVVVTRALHNLDVAHASLFRGSFVELTLLDPHPANNNFGAWGDWATGYLTDKSLLSYLFYRGTLDFQRAVRDPRVVIPPGVKHTEVWWQHTKADLLTALPYEESSQNLWGVVTLSLVDGQPGGSIVNDSGVSIASGSLRDLTDQNVPGIGFVGHIEVPYVYLKQVVDAGALTEPAWANAP